MIPDIGTCIDHDCTHASITKLQVDKAQLSFSHNSNIIVHMLAAMFKPSLEHSSLDMYRCNMRMYAMCCVYIFVHASSFLFRVLVSVTLNNDSGNRLLMKYSISL